MHFGNICAGAAPGRQGASAILPEMRRSSNEEETAVEILAAVTLFSLSLCLYLHQWSGAPPRRAKARSGAGQY